MTGKQLRERRKAMGLTQEQLADILGVSPNTIARWERGEMKIPSFLSLAIETIERKAKD
jgi:transcriptional regulator with XRE-family HTH domain